jgi:phosphohistidine phosphatase
MAERGFAPDAIVASPKLRARQTAELFADALGIAFTLDDRLGESLDPDDVGAIVERVGGTSVVLVGHDPDFSTLAGVLIGMEYLPMKKGAMARIDMSLPIQPDGGVLRWLLPPELLVDRS